MTESPTLTLNTEKHSSKEETPSSQSDHHSRSIFQTIRGAFVVLLEDMERSPGFMSSNSTTKAIGRHGALAGLLCLGKFFDRGGSPRRIQPVDVFDL